MPEKLVILDFLVLPGRMERLDFLAISVNLVKTVHLGRWDHQDRQELMVYPVHLVQMDYLEKLEKQVSLGKKALLVREVMMDKMVSLVFQDRQDECCPPLVLRQMVSLVKRANEARPARSDIKANPVSLDKMVPMDRQAERVSLANQESKDHEVLLEMLLALLSLVIVRVLLFQNVQLAR